MDNIDATDRSIRAPTAPPPSLLSIILDTNPLSWSRLSPHLPLQSVLQTLLIFINAHLAFNTANQVTVLASHVDRVAWLYPTPVSDPQNQPNGVPDSFPPRPNANKYRPFLDVEQQVRRNLRALFANNTPPSTADLATAPMLAGALSTALTTVNTRTLLAAPNSFPSSTDAADGGTASTTGGADSSLGAADLDTHTTEARHHMASASASLVSRVLYVSVSVADLSTQYIGLMNAVFAAQRLRVPVDILTVGPRPAFLQQACDATGGVFMTFEPPPAPAASNGAGSAARANDAAAMGLLQTLMMAYLPDATARHALVTPGSTEVDFRAACFCHGKVVDLGGVCSVCLSIFCIPLETPTCPTCQSVLKAPKSLTVKPAVVPRKRTKKKRRAGGGGETGRDTPGLTSGAATPAAGGGTPATTTAAATPAHA